MSIQTKPNLASNKKNVYNNAEDIEFVILDLDTGDHTYATLSQF